MKSILPRQTPFVVSGYSTLLLPRLRPSRLCRLFLALALPLSCYQLRAQAPSSELHIAAAADLQPVLPALAAAFQQQSGIHLISTFGSSATLTQQITNGAPVDVFLSADCSHPQQLVDAHLSVEPQPLQYATGVLVLWARKDSPAQPLSLGSLTSPRVSRVAVANDRHAPYGQAATAELNALGLLPALTSKLVIGENIMQTAQFADTGNAQAAFISLTIASSLHFRETGTFVPLPRKYPPIRQCGVTLTHAAARSAGQRFLEWLTNPATQRRLPQLGLNPAEEPRAHS